MTKIIKSIVFGVVLMVLVAAESAIGLPIISLIVVLLWSRQRKWAEATVMQIWLGLLLATAYNASLVSSYLLVLFAAIATQAIKPGLKLSLLGVTGISLLGAIGYGWLILGKISGQSLNYMIVVMVVLAGYFLLNYRNQKIKFELDLKWWEK